MTSPLGTALQTIADGADVRRLPTPEAVRAGGDRRRRTTLALAAAVAVACSVLVVALAALGPSDPSTAPVAPTPGPTGTPRAEESDPMSSSHQIETGTHRFSAHAIAAIDGRFVVVGDSSDLENPGPPVYWSDNGVDWQAPRAGDAPDSVNVTDVISTPEGLLAVGVDRGGTAAAWRSADGLTWAESPVMPPDSGRDGGLWGVTATGLGYYAWGFQDGSAHLWRSVDGSSWVPVADESVFDLDQAETICAVRDASGGLRATGVAAPRNTRVGNRVVWTSADGETWVRARTAGATTYWCDPTDELGHWEARGDAGVVSVYPYDEGNTAELTPPAPDQ